MYIAIWLVLSAVRFKNGGDEKEDKINKLFTGQGVGPNGEKL